MAGKKPNNQRGAFATDTKVGGMLGYRRPQPEVFDDLLKSQQRHGEVKADEVARISKDACASEASVRGVASFYSLLEPSDAPKPDGSIVRVCDGPSCCLLDAESLQRKCHAIALGDDRIERSSCLGYCEQAPAMMVDRPDGARVIVCGAASSIVDLEELPLASPPCDLKLLGHPSPDLLRRPLTKRFGVVDSRSIDAALSTNVYLALAQALDTDQDEIIQTVESAGLRGRGGAGFDTGTKWRIAAEAVADQRYVICNADESEPGTFKDRMLMENDPHTLVEGMAICGRAIGATRGIIYIRGEYVVAAEILEHAIAEARERGFLGRDIQGSSFQFDISIHRGAGAYICGEETALLESLEGKRGEPRERPPFPATNGYLGLPTVVNNVETFCSVPSIIHDGPEQYRDLGRGIATGTKLFCLSGHVAQPGLCEAAMGVPLRQLVQEFGGGMRDGREFKFALTGGAAGTFVPESLLDVPLAYESWSEGVAVGSGAVIVADQSVNAAEMLLWVLRFFEHESCGKCTPCRVGTVQAREIVARIVAGNGEPGDVDRLLRLSKTLDATSFCGLGQSVAWPIESAVKHFPSDFK